MASSSSNFHEEGRFLSAAKNGDLILVKRLAPLCTSLEIKDSAEMTGLMLAAQHGYPKTVEFLLQSGANVHAKDSAGWNALHYAALNGPKSSVQAILKRQAGVATLNVSGGSALHLACEGNHVEIVELLLSNGAEVNQADNMGWTALHLTAREGQDSIARLLLGTSQRLPGKAPKAANINAITNDGMSALHIAAEKGHHTFVLLLLERGINLDAGMNDGWTALHFAAQNNHKNIAELLLSHGAQINSTANDLSMPLHTAIKSGNEEMAFFLIDKGANVNAFATEDMLTPLHMSASTGRLQLLGTLLLNGADLMSRDTCGCTALHMAAERDDKENLDCARLLLEDWDVNVNLGKSNGQTALHVAASNGNEDMATLLLDHGANIHAEEDKSGYTPLDMAVEENHEGMVLLLLRRGADVMNGEGRPMFLAKTNGHDQMARLLIKNGADIEGYEDLVQFLEMDDNSNSESKRSKAPADTPRKHVKAIHPVRKVTAPLAKKSASKRQKVQRLCATCRSIDFEAILFKVSGNSLNSNSSESSSESEVDFGFLDELIRRSPTCQFCSLALEAATRINFGDVPQTITNGERVRCVVSGDYFCTLYDAIHRGQAGCEVEVNRLVVNFDPQPYPSLQMKQIMFQPYAESIPGSDKCDNRTGSGRIIGDQINVKTLRDWLRRCQDHHGENCSVPKWLGNTEQPGSLKVIDVKRRCVTAAPPKCRYLALSYVWGACQTFQSTTANITQFRRENGFDKEIVPKTIADAMALVLELGERYLWVDALCIVQDDDKDKAEQIMQMDFIYAGALLTIIAAGGNDAQAGLPGLLEGTRNVKQGIVRVGESWSLMQTLAQGFDGHLQNSTWNSRGWTFQERLLSRRALFFTQDQVYWMCETATWNEETVLESAKPRYWVLPQALGCRDEWDDGDPKFTMEALHTYITQYSTRQFTNQSDALAGFSGILRRITYQESENFHWGLPHTRFDQALTWKYGTERRKDHCQIHHVPFPSWSWLGWTGFIGAHSVDSDLQELTLKGKSSPEISFYKLGIDGRVQEIKSAVPLSAAAQLQLRKSVRDRFEDMRRRWKGSTIVRSPISIRTKGSGSLADESLPPPQLAPEIGEWRHDTPTISQPFRDTGRLVFWTSHASLFARMGKEDKISVDIKGKDTPLSDANGYFTKMMETNQQLDLIVISRSCLYSKELGSLNLLVVKWSETELDVASRIGSCSIDETNWVRADREWKLIVLQ